MQKCFFYETGGVKTSTGILLKSKGQRVTLKKSRNKVLDIQPHIYLKTLDICKDTSRFFFLKIVL